MPHANHDHSVTTPMPWWVAPLLLCWVACIVSVFIWIGRHSNKHGEHRAVQYQLDGAVESGFQAHFFVHPQCPCTQASVEELDRLLTRLGPDLRVPIVAHVYTPADATEDWHRNSMIQRLAQLPGVTLVHDIDGRDTTRFGVATSGHLLIYRAGVLAYSGGLTSSRGHVGLSDGGETAYQLLTGTNQPEHMQAVAWVVFGCELLSIDQCASPAVEEMHR